MPVAQLNAARPIIRRFNGHTQINATDLRNLRYPSKKELGDLGQHGAAANGRIKTRSTTLSRSMSEPRPLSSVFVIEQTAIDVETDPIRRRITEAQALLAALNFDSARCNERSALTLLALLALRPEDPWASAGSTAAADR